MNISLSDSRKTQQPALAAWQRACSFPVLLGALLVAGAFVSTSWEGSVPGGKVFIDNDTWWHLVTGQRILTTRTWPTTDPYSFSAPGGPWIASEWAGEIVIAAAHRLWGLQGMAALLIGLGVTLELLLYYLAYLRSGNSKAAAAACALTLPMLGSFFNMRPQMLGYIFLAVELICLELFRQGRQKALWILPALFVVWVNTHGTYVLGLGILGLYFAAGWLDFRHAGLVAIRWTAGEKRRLLIVILLGGAALMLNPYGWRVLAVPYDFALRRPLSLASGTDWYPIALRGELPVKLFMVLTLLFLLSYAILSPAVYRLEEIVLLFLAIYKSSFQVRFLFFFSVIFAPLLAAMLARWIPNYQREKDKHALNFVMMALLLAGLALYFPSARDLQGMLKRDAPQGAVDFLRQHPRIDPVFNESWGGYLIWSGRKVFLDGRLEYYEPSGVLSDYLSIVNLYPNTLVLLHKYGVEACLLKKNSPLETYLAAQADWKRVYADDLSAIYENQDLRSAAAPAGSEGEGKDKRAASF